jgi:hypothetical protein
MMLRVDDPRGPWQAVEPGADAPTYADAALPRVAVLAGVGAISGSLSQGVDPPPVPTLSVSLLRDAAELVAEPPLGARATLYDRAGVVVFAGRVRRVASSVDRVAMDLDSERPA